MRKITQSTIPTHSFLTSTITQSLKKIGQEMFKTWSGIGIADGPTDGWMVGWMDGFCVIVGGWMVRCPRSAKQIMTLSMLSTTLRLNGSSRPRVRSFYTNERTWTVYMTIWRASGIRSFHLTIVACQLMTCGSVSSRRFSRLLKGLFHQK